MAEGEDGTLLRCWNAGKQKRLKASDSIGLDPGSNRRRASPQAARPRSITASRRPTAKSTLTLFHKGT